MRACSATALVLAAAAALSGCGALGSAPASTPEPSSSSSSSTAVIDPSVPSATPVATVAPSASPTPVEKVTAAPAPKDSRTAVTPFITSALWDAKTGRLDVSAIVPGVVEEDGTCIVTATSGDTERRATAGGVAASSYTGCEAVSFTGLAAGTWQVRVRYTSDHAVGASASRAVRAG